MAVWRASRYRSGPLELMPYKVNEPRRHKIPKARYRVENWAAYDEALRRRGEWHLEKHGGTARRCWSNLHLAVAPATGEILASALTGNEEGDASLVGPLLDQVTGPIGAVLADGAYDGEPVYRAVAAHTPDAEVIIPPRATAVVSDTAESAPTRRDRHILTIKERGRLGWQRAVQYGRGSLVEAAMLRYKVLIGHSLRARTLPAQKAEAKAACAVINRMTSLGMPTSRKVA